MKKFMSENVGVGLLVLWKNLSTFTVVFQGHFSNKKNLVTFWKNDHRNTFIILNKFLQIIVNSQNIWQFFLYKMLKIWNNFFSKILKILNFIFSIIVFFLIVLNSVNICKRFFFHIKRKVSTLIRKVVKLLINFLRNKITLFFKCINFS